MRIASILLLEYEPVISRDMQLELTQMGFTVYPAFQLSEALDICQQHLPDAALINFKLEGDSNGARVAEMLRARFQMKVLLITGARAEEFAPVFRVGKEVLCKPFTRMQLRSAIASAASGQ